MISNLAEVHEALQDLAYPAELHPEAVITWPIKRGTFPVIVTINTRSELVISCQIAKLGAIQEDRLTEFAFAALDANSRLSPFAISIITEADSPMPANKDENEEKNYPIVLVDNIPLGDLSKDELRKAFESLHAALIGSREVLEAGMPAVASLSCRHPDPAPTSA